MDVLSDVGSVLLVGFIGLLVLDTIATVWKWWATDRRPSREERQRTTALDLAIGLTSEGESDEQLLTRAASFEVFLRTGVEGVDKAKRGMRK